MLRNGASHGNGSLAVPSTRYGVAERKVWFPGSHSEVGGGSSDAAYRTPLSGGCSPVTRLVGNAAFANQAVHPDTITRFESDTVEYDPPKLRGYLESPGHQIAERGPYPKLNQKNPISPHGLHLLPPQRLQLLAFQHDWSRWRIRRGIQRSSGARCSHPYRSAGLHVADSLH